MKVKISELEKIVTKILRKEYSADKTALIKDVVMFGELSGRKTHGILRLLKENYGVFTDNIKGEPEIIKKTKVSSLIDSKGNVGMLIGPMAMLEVIKLAKKNGIGIVGTKGSINSTGALSFYCERIAKENLISIIFTQSNPMMAPFSSKKALFGTNPIAFGIPSDPYPSILDMSTSAITFGSIAGHKLSGKRLPKNVAIDKDGKMTRDASMALKGATLAFDNSYKGSGLAMMVEVLGGVLTGASFAGENNEQGWGNLYIALSPNLLSDIKSFKQNAKKLIDIIKSAETRNADSIRIPGEHTLRVRDENQKKGEIEIDDSLLEKLEIK